MTKKKGCGWTLQEGWYLGYGKPKLPKPLVCGKDGVLCPKCQKKEVKK
ncbi:MAG: hypothetical protein IIB81_04305 [Nanoarchaeota archaeon]|nr:hypothetical protein [Nanoarchaeota archaeon]